MVKKMYHLNDRTMKYKTSAQTKRQHQYFGLPGTFKMRLPQEIAFPNLEVGRADEFYCTEESLIIDFEEESDVITFKTMDKFSKYAIFASYRYEGRIYLVVLCHKDPKKEFEYFEYAPSLYIKVHYIHISQAELWARYENIINKVKHKIRLTEMEALDMAFVAKFISKKHAPIIVESLVNIFNDAIIDDELLKTDVGVILGGMIQKHFKSIEKQNRLMEKINMRQINNFIEELVYNEFGEVLDKRDEKIEAQAQEIESNKKEIEFRDAEIESKDAEIDKLNQQKDEVQTKLKSLSEFKDLNSPEARAILNSLILVR
ncbi:MAG: hypothetical protein IJI96_06235 [Methanobrevibacter sp.]|nr:hypothetical protein [Methanobrevibacter sp.]